MHGQWSNPAYAQPGGKPQVIFPGGDGWIYSFNPNGELCSGSSTAIPKMPFIDSADAVRRTTSLARPSFTRTSFTSPSARTRSTILVLDTFIASTSRRLQRVKTKMLSPTLVVSRTNQNCQEEAKSGLSTGLALRWSSVTEDKPSPTDETYYFGRSMSTCAIMDDLLYITELGGHVHCLDAITGELYWTENMFSNTWSSPMCR